MSRSTRKALRNKGSGYHPSTFPVTFQLGLGLGLGLGIGLGLGLGLGLALDLMLRSLGFLYYHVSTLQYKNQERPQYRRSGEPVHLSTL